MTPRLANIFTWIRRFPARSKNTAIVCAQVWRIHRRHGLLLAELNKQRAAALHEMDELNELIHKVPENRAQIEMRYARLRAENTQAAEIEVTLAERRDDKIADVLSGQN